MPGVAGNISGFLLTLLGFGRKPAENWQPRRVLVTRIQNLGDCIVFIPTLRALRQIWPLAEIDVLAGTSVGEAVFQMVPEVNRVLRTKWPGPLTNKEKREQVRMFAAGHYDALLLSTEETGMALKGFLSGIPVRVGFTRVTHMNENHRERLPFLHTYRLCQPETLHEAEVNCQIARLFGYRGDTPGAVLDIPNDSVAEAVLLLQQLGIEGKGFVCVHPGTSQPVKNWGVQNFAIACDMICDQGLTPVFVGIPEEADLIQQIQGQMHGASVSLAGKTSLPVLAAVLRHSAGFLGNDSGPMHLAAATGIPVTAVFVASLPEVWGPWNPGGYKSIFLPEDADPVQVANSVIQSARQTQGFESI